MRLHEADPPLRLDGARLATARSAALAVRVERVRATRGRAPGLALLAGAEAGLAPPHVALKQRAAARLGVDVHALLLPFDAGLDAWIDAVARAAAEPATDAVFVQYPLPGHVDPQPVFNAIPVELDVDVLSTAALDRFERGLGPPPATVAAAFAILDAYAVTLNDRDVRIVGQPGALARSFRVMFERRGALVDECVAAAGPGLRDRVAGAALVLTLGGQPGCVPAADLPDGAVVIDGGYFNEGGAGDVDLASGADHIGALVPVPGGLGPMTISVLLERTIARGGG